MRYQANKAADERLLLLPGQFDGFRGWMVLHNTSGGLSSTTTTVGELVAARSPMPFSECLVAYATMCLTKLRPAGRNSGTGRAHAAGIWGRMGRPTVLAEAVELVGRGNRDRRDPLPGCVGSARGRRGRRQVRGEGWADRRLDDHVFEKIASGPVRRVEGAEVSSGPADVQRDRRAWAIRCARCASAASRGPRSASEAGSSPERAPNRSAGATRAFPDAADVLVMVDTRTWRAVSTFCIGNLMVRGRTPSRAGTRRRYRDAGVLVDGRSGGRWDDGHRSPACHRGLGPRRDASGIG